MILPSTSVTDAYLCCVTVRLYLQIGSMVFDVSYFVLHDGFQPPIVLKYLPLPHLQS